MRYLITGLSGLIGFHLGESLLERGVEVVATIHRSARNLRHLQDRIRLIPCDFADRVSVERLLEAGQPDTIFHLAAQSHPTVSWEDPEATIKTNLLGTLYLFDGVKRVNPKCTIVLAGSSAEYSFGRATRSQFDEKTLIQPSSPYGVAKAAASSLAMLYVRAYQMRIVLVRPFAVIGPGEASNAPADFARQIARIENGLQHRLPVGNLEAERDFLDVRDAVKALGILAEKGQPGEVYNLCAAQGTSVRAVLDYLISLASQPIQVDVDPAKFRPLDAHRVVGDNAKLRQLGWEPTIALEQTLADMLAYWRSRVAGVENETHPGGSIRSPV